MALELFKKTSKNNYTNINNINLYDFNYGRIFRLYHQIAKSTTINKHNVNKKLQFSNKKLEIILLSPVD
jgi:hypothetical protein